MKKRLLASFLLFAGFLSVSYALEDKEVALTPANLPLMEEALQKIRQEFEPLRLTADDFKLTAASELPLSIKTLESFFEDPLQVAALSSRWATSVEEAAGPSDLLQLSRLVLKDSFAFKGKSTTAVPAIKIPGKPIALFKELYPEFVKAHRLLNQAVASASAQNRSAFMRLYEWPDNESGAVQQEISSRRIKKAYEGMQDFRQDKVLEAADLVLKALGKAGPKISQLRTEKNITWVTPIGAFVVRTAKDDTYSAEDLNKVALLIDLGGNNTYAAPMGRAGPGEIRVVIDAGADVRIEGDQGRGQAGTGIFGIGVAMLTNGKGVKKIESGPFSQGFGLGGVGILSINGPAQLTADRYVQGCGILGVGILRAQAGNESIYTANRSGQGCGLIRGVGIFSHEGSKADIKGGLVQPDPREPLGAFSMCQGVGFGHRAFTGGGVGIAVVSGDNTKVQGSYFAQGCGYWKSLGVFRFRGNQSTLQARRYDMGSGVHSAFGHFDLFGNSNRVLNWGVGPSHGWDHSIASALINGNENEVQVDWGAGMAQIDSLAYSYIKGDRNQLKLPGVGSGSFFRSMPSYSIQLIEGNGTMLEAIGEIETKGEDLRHMPNPWGSLRIKGTSLVSKLDLLPPQWPELPQAPAVRREMVNLQAQISSAQKKSVEERISDLVDIASAFSVDKESPREALLALLALPPGEVSALVKSLEPAAIDQLIRLNVIIPAHWPHIFPTILEELSGAPIPRKTALISFIRNFPPAQAVPALLALFDQNEDVRVKAAAARSAGLLFNRDQGQEPGSRVMLEALLKYMSGSRSRKSRAETISLLSRTTPPEAYGLLSTGIMLNAEKRQQFIMECPEDITSPIQNSGAASLLKLTEQLGNSATLSLREELRVLEESEPLIREKLQQVLSSTRPAMVQTAVVALGQIGNADDIRLLAPLLTHEKAAIREASAVALARMGDSGVVALKKAMEEGSLQTRLLVLAGAPQTLSTKVESIIKAGVVDPDPLVRQAALTSLRNLPEGLKKMKSALISQTKSRLKNETDANVRLALSLLR